MLGLGLSLPQIAIRQRLLGTGPAPMPVFKAAIAGVQAGIRRARILVIGSSITCGVHMGDSATTSNDYDADSFKNAWSAAMGSALTTAGINCSYSSFMGDQNYVQFSNTPYPYSGYVRHNPEVALGASFSASTGQGPSGVGGSCFFTNVNSAYGSFSPRIPVTTFELYLDDVNSVPFNYQVDGGSISGSATGANGGLKKVVTVAVSKGTHLLNFQNASTGYVQMRGVIAYDATTPAVDIVNLGWNGGSSVNWSNTTNPHDYGNVLGALSPDLIIIETEVNDSIYATTTAYQTNMSKLIGLCKATGADVLLVTSPPYANGQTYNGATLPDAATRAQFTAITKQIASQNGIGVTDLVAYFGSYAAMNAAGQMFDIVHPNKAGGAAMGQKVAADLLAALAATPASTAPVILAILAGQSNIVGLNAREAGDTDAVRLYQFATTPGGPNYHAITSDTTPLQFPYTATGDDYYSPGEALGRQLLADNPSADVVLLPTARGSTAMAAPGDPWYPSMTSGGALFENMIAEAALARTAITAQFPGRPISVQFYWIQGEQDANNGIARAAYLASLTNVIAFARARITGAGSAPFTIGSMVPELWVAGGPTYSAAYAAINQAHVDASLGIAGVRYAAGPLYVSGAHDNLHYQPVDRARTMGTRLGQALTDVAGPSVTSTATAATNVGVALAKALTGSDQHQTFSINGGANAGLFEISDAYLNPVLRWSGNGTGPATTGDYVVGVRARDGAGNYGATQTITVTQAAAIPAPTGATWNPADHASQITLSNANLTATNAVAAGAYLARATTPKSTGKWAARMQNVFSTAGGGYFALGVGSANASLTNGLGNGESIGFYDTGPVYYNGGASSSGGSYVSGDQVTIAFDADAKKVWFAVNGSWLLGDPVAGTGGQSYSNFSAVHLMTMPAALNGYSVLSAASVSGFTSLV